MTPLILSLMLSREQGQKQREKKEKSIRKNE